jgi:predicted unusual protein kinase regulating ubiquinone biosynthesis (AarF/ABC1/UbiB family)
VSIDEDSKLPPTSRLSRIRKIAGLSAQLSGEMLSRGVRKLAGADPTGLSVSAAEKLVSTLGDLKGAAMKLGQVISMDPELFTPEVRGILARLQNQAPAMSYERVREVVKEELGAPPESLYARFEREPLAAASLGQVHRATLPDGREVAVKVQYPGIGQALAADLDNLGFLVGTVARTSRALDGRLYYQELRNELSLELDYRREAALAQGFARACLRLPDLKVPDVVESHTGQRVLTLELLNGKTLKDFLASEPTAPERFRVSCLLIRATYGPFLECGEMHADPHPGNFMVMSDGRLGLLDFGSVKRFSPTFVDVNRRLFQRALHKETLDVLALSREVGFSIELPDDDARALIGEVLHIAGRPLRVPEYDYAACEISRDMKRLFATNATRFLKLRPPSEAVMFFRSTGGLSQNLRALSGKGDFRPVYAELSSLGKAS